MSIDNGVVVLAPNVPASMRFSQMVLSSHRRRDPITKLESSVKELACQVIELNGQPILEVFDTLSEKLMRLLLAYKDDPNLSSKVFTITQTGSGYLTEYMVRVG